VPAHGTGKDMADNLPANNTHIVSVVLFGLRENEIGEIESNNFIATAYQKEIG
jgi:hypothetical protein